MHIKQGPARIKAGPEGGLGEREFKVYPSTFTKTPDADGDIVARGAFADSLAEWRLSKAPIPGLFGHRMDDPDYYVASGLEYGEDEIGWWVKGTFDTHQKAERVYQLAKDGRLSQLSFAYDVLDAATVQLEDGDEAYELRRLKIYEFSFVPIGANQETFIAEIKSMASRRLIDVKEGRVLAAKHINSLRGAQEAIGLVIAAAEGTTDEEKGAKGAPDPNGSPKAQPAADAFVLFFELES